MAANPESILDSIKAALGVAADYTAFDIDIIMHVNTALGILRQAGVGPVAGFVIADNTLHWDDFSPDMDVLAAVKSYIYLVVRLLFDPPATSFALDSMHKLRNELEWRLNIEGETQTPPTPPPFFDGGELPTWFSPKVVTLFFEPVITPDATDGNVFYLTMTDDCQINMPANGHDGEHITLEITSAGFSVTWGAGWNFGGQGIPVLTPEGHDIISAVFRETYGEWHAGWTPGF